MHGRRKRAGREVGSSWTLILFTHKAFFHRPGSSVGSVRKRVRFWRRLVEIQRPIWAPAFLAPELSRSSFLTRRTPLRMFSDLDFSFFCIC